jgi:peroxiredoxin
MAALAAVAQPPRNTFTVPMRPDLRKDFEAYIPMVPTHLELGPGRPDGLVKEPLYRGTPRYGVIYIGNGPRARHVLALDEPAHGDSRLFVDVNGNGDLTDDGDGTMPHREESKGQVRYDRLRHVFRASYGTATKESASGPYALSFYFQKGSGILSYFRQTRQVGVLNLNGKRRTLVMMEDDSDGIFNRKPDVRLDRRRHHGVRLWVGTGRSTERLSTFGQIDLKHPFQLSGTWYDATVAVDGSRITFRRLAGRPLEAKLPLTPAPLKNGTLAPDFSARRLSGGQVRLQDFRGRVVLLAFWQCTQLPCIEYLNYLQDLQLRLQGQNVTVIPIGTMEEDLVLKDWVSIHLPDLRLNLFLDPGTYTSDSVAYGQYHTYAVPATFLIAPDGRIADSILGHSPKQVEQALIRLGLHLK